MSYRGVNNQWNCEVWTIRGGEQCWVRKIQGGKNPGGEQSEVRIIQGGNNPGVNLPRCEQSWVRIIQGGKNLGGVKHPSSWYSKRQKSWASPRRLFDPRVWRARVKHLFSFTVCWCIWPSMHARLNHCYQSVFAWCCRTTVSFFGKMML